MESGGRRHHCGDISVAGFIGFVEFIGFGGREERRRVGE